MKTHRGNTGLALLCF